MSFYPDSPTDSSEGERFGSCLLQRKLHQIIGCMEIVGVPEMLNEAEERGKEKHQESGVCRKRKRTTAHLPKSLRTAFGKQGSSSRRQRKFATR